MTQGRGQYESGAGASMTQGRGQYESGAGPVWRRGWARLSHHVVAVELLHDGRLVEELDAFAHAGRLVDGLDGHARFRLVLHHALGDALVHHAERALPQLPGQRHLLPRDLPLVWYVHCTQTERERETLHQLHTLQRDTASAAHTLQRDTAPAAHTLQRDTASAAHTLQRDTAPAAHTNKSKREATSVTHKNTH